MFLHLFNNMADAGARYITILNHFNEFYRQCIAMTTNDEETSSLGAFLRKSFNQGIYSEVNKLAPSANIIYVDYAKLIEEVAICFRVSKA